MPEEDYTWLPRADILSLDEINQLVAVFVELGVDKIRLTGGEPLLRPELPKLVAALTAIPGVRDVAMTTNAVLLARHVDDLHRAGLNRITVSLDTLRPDRFTTLTRRGTHADVLAGIRSIAEAGCTGTKIDTVVIRGMNDDELADIVEFGRTVSAEVRFIEYMDVGGATGWRSDQVVSRDEMLTNLRGRYGPITELPRTDSAPADRFALPDGTVFGIIASTTQPFCATCDRSRLTADGLWYRCLYALSGTDLRTPLRAGRTPAELAARIVEGWRARADQGAVVRLRSRNRDGQHVGIEQLRGDPHLEMHTRGG